MPQQQSRSGRVLFVYASSQTYTSTVFEHLDAFRKYSACAWFYLDIAKFNQESFDLSSFDAVVVHYSVRLPFGQLGSSAQNALKRFRGLKGLFIQDEYDGTNAVKKIINAVGFDLVFSVVPEHSLEKIYPASEFPKTRFVSNFTGYVPDEIETLFNKEIEQSKRSLTIAYRGRPLPLRYGKLGQEKVEIGRRVKAYCLEHGIPCDIAWEESARIYGDDWYRFICSAKAMLGSESGSNVFDWDGNLASEIDRYRRANPRCSEADVYREMVAKREMDGLMNQLSPRIFEMAAAKTVMVLLEGAYSGVLVPHVHYVPLRKDFSNLAQVFATLADDSAVDAMVKRAYEDIILSGRYSYQAFAGMVDEAMQATFNQLGVALRSSDGFTPPVERGITHAPFKARPPLPAMLTNNRTPFKQILARLVIAAWQKVPMGLRPYIKRMLGRV